MWSKLIPNSPLCRFGLPVPNTAGTPDTDVRLGHHRHKKDISYEGLAEFEKPVELTAA